MLSVNQYNYNSNGNVSVGNESDCYLNNGENKTKSDVSPHFGSSIRMHIHVNVVFPANLSVIFCLIAT